MSEVKLLTERELLGLLEWNTPKQILDELRERGLIKPEPVDPVRLMAVQIMDYLNPQGDEQDINWIVNTILRPGIDALELAERKELTRDMVLDAVSPRVIGSDYAVDYYGIHAALVERLK